MTWGIMSSGLCLTANILESLNQGEGFSLSDILIPDAPGKYYLSSAQVEKLLYVNLCLAMSAQAISQRSTVMRKTMSDNELFTFRVWLVRLGLNGEEFKNTRNHLLANLDGDRAWRYDKDSYEVNKKKKKSREMER